MNKPYRWLTFFVMTVIMTLAQTTYAAQLCSDTFLHKSSHTIIRWNDNLVLTAKDSASESQQLTEVRIYGKSSGIQAAHYDVPGAFQGYYILEKGFILLLTDSQLVFIDRLGKFRGSWFIKEPFIVQEVDINNINVMSKATDAVLKKIWLGGMPLD